MTDESETIHNTISIFLDRSVHFNALMVAISVLIVFTTQSTQSTAASIFERLDGRY